MDLATFELQYYRNTRVFNAYFELIKEQKTD